jgi:hypothetical protein
MTRAAQLPGVVDALVAAGLVDAGRREEAQQVISGALAAPETARTSSRGLLVEIAAYVGGALVVASLVLFLAQQWTNLSDGGQVAALATIAGLLAVASASAARVGGGVAPLRAGRDDVRRRLTAALLTAAALAASVTVGRAVDLQVGQLTGNGSWPVLAGALTMLVLAALAYAFVASVLGQLAMLGAVFVAVTSGWSLFDEMQNSTLWPGLAFLGIGVVWLAFAERGYFTEVWLARAIGAGTTLWGAQFVRFGDDHNAVAYALMLAVSVAAFATYLRTVSWPYLVVGVLGITLVVPEAIIDWTAGSLGPAGGVLVAGLTLLGASLAGFRVRQEVTEAGPPA